MSDTKEDFSSLFEMIPNASLKDVETLIEEIGEAQKRLSAEVKDVQNWAPNKTTVL